MYLAEATGANGNRLVQKWMARGSCSIHDAAIPHGQECMCRDATPQAARPVSPTALLLR